MLCNIIKKYIIDHHHHIIISHAQEEVKKSFLFSILLESILGTPAKTRHGQSKRLDRAHRVPEINVEPPRCRFPKLQHRMLAAFLISLALASLSPPPPLVQKVQPEHGALHGDDQIFARARVHAVALETEHERFRVVVPARHLGAEPHGGDGIHELFAQVERQALSAPV